MYMKKRRNTPLSSLYTFLFNNTINIMNVYCYKMLSVVSKRLEPQTKHIFKK